MSVLRRLEFWDNVEPAGGLRQALIGQTTWLGVTERRTIEGENTMTLRLLRDNPALASIGSDVMNADPHLVLRAQYSDGEIVERRIESVALSSQDGLQTIDLIAHGMMHELSFTGVCFRERSSLARSYYFQASNLSAASHLANYILPALWEAGEPWWAAGTIDTADEVVTVVYDMDSPLAALRKLINAHAAQRELEVVFDPGVQKYRINIRALIGAAAAPIRLRAGVGLNRLGLTRSVADTTNRIYAFGSTDEELGRATMGRNAWNLKAQRVAGGAIFVAMEDPAGGPGPIAFDGQYVDVSAGKYRLTPIRPSAQHFFIIGSSATTQEFEVEEIAGSGSAVIDIWYRIEAPTRELAYVERRGPLQGMERDFGVRVGSVVREEIPGTVNYLRNPFARWLTDDPSDTVPEDWFGASSIATSFETNPIYYRTGDKSVRALFGSSDFAVLIMGLNTGWITSGLVSYFADVLTIAGQVEVGYTVFLTQHFTLPGGQSVSQLTYPNDYLLVYPNAERLPEPRSTKLGQFERIGSEGVHDATKYPVSGMRVEVRQATGAPSTHCIIDAAQVTNTSTYRDLMEGSGGTVLLQSANAALVRGADLSEEVGIDTLDLASVGDDRFPFHHYVLGGPIVLTDPALGVEVRTRVLGWDRDWFQPEALRVTISARANDVTRVLASRVSTPAAPVEMAG